MDRLAMIIPEGGGPTAVLACGYYLALDTMKVLRRLNKRIPDDVSLVSFDDSKSAGLLDPPLTVVKQPLEDMGALAYDRVVQLARGENALPQISRLPTSLIRRESAGPPPGSRES